MHKGLCVCGFAVFLSLGVSGCVSKELSKRLLQRETEVRDQTFELARANQLSDAMFLDWKTAVKMLEERNLNLQQARIRIKQAKKDQANQWKTWLPRLAVYTSLQSSLAQLGSLSSSDLDASVVAPLNVPNPFTERATAFQLALTTLQAEDAYILSYRRQVATLYRLYSNYEQLEAERDRTNAAMAKSVAIANGMRSLETSASYEDSVANIQSSMAQMLDLPGQKPTPIAKTRPSLNYDSRIHQLVPGKNYGQLAVRLSAYQLEAALLQEKGIKFNQWPSFAMGSSSPSLYQSNNGSSNNSFEADNIYLFGGLSKSYDLTGREEQSIQTAEQNTEFVKKNLRLNLDRESRTWITLKTRYQQLSLKERLGRERLQLTRARTTGGSPMSELKTLRMSESSLAGLNRAKEQLVMELWIWDDSKWK